MLSVKLDLQPQVIQDLDLIPVSPETVDEVLNAMEGPTEEIEISISLQLKYLIERVEALDKTDNTIKALGKLKGALELLS